MYELISLELQGSNSYGWTWTVRDGDREVEYFTNRRGDGLFHRIYGGAISQDEGTAQWSMTTYPEAGNEEAAVREICSKWGLKDVRNANQKEDNA